MLDQPWIKSAKATGAAAERPFGERTIFRATQNNKSRNFITSSEKVALATVGAEFPSAWLWAGSA